MSKLKKIIFMFVVASIFMSYGAVIYADEAQFSEVELAKYRKVYNNPYVKHIRTALDTFLAKKDSEVNYLPGISIQGFEDLKKIDSSIYSSKFTVFNFKLTFGGFYVSSIIFKKNMDKMFNAWVYQIADGTYELRKLEDLNVAKEKMNKLYEKYKSIMDDNEHAL